MKVHEILLELTYEQVPPSEYGYWIAPSGKLIPVDIMQHLRVAEKFFDFKSSNRREMFKQIFNEGWVRVTFRRYQPDDFSAQMTTSVSNKAKQNLIYFLRLFKDQIQTVHISIVDVPNGEGNFAPPNAAGKAINFVNQHT